jgi:Tol biopolymer transport system component
MAGGDTPERLPFVGDDGLMPVVSSRQNGGTARLVYVRSFADSNIWRLDTAAAGQAAASLPVVAISSTRRDEEPQLSPDGRRTVFVSSRSGENEIWVADTNGANAAQLTFQRANPGFPRWSPDGQRIVYHSDADEASGDVFVVAASGGRPRNLTPHDGADTFPSFSLDGRWVYFNSSRAGALSIWKVPASGGEAVQVSPRFAFLALESTDGASLFYVDSPAMTTAGALMRLPLKGGAPERIATDVDPMCFHVIEDGIYFIERHAGDAGLRYYDFGSRRSTLVAGNLGNVTFGLTASRDGRTIFFSRVDSSIDDLMLVDNFR